MHYAFRTAVERERYQWTVRERREEEKMCIVIIPDSFMKCECEQNMTAIKLMVPDQRQLSTGDERTRR